MDVTVIFQEDPDLDGSDDMLVLQGTDFDDLNQLVSFWLRATQAVGYTYVDIMTAKSLEKKLEDRIWTTGW